MGAHKLRWGVKAERERERGNFCEWETHRDNRRTYRDEKRFRRDRGALGTLSRIHQARQKSLEPGLSNSSVFFTHSRISRSVPRSRKRKKSNLRCRDCFFLNIFERQLVATYGIHWSTNLCEYLGFVRVMDSQFLVISLLEAFFLLYFVLFTLLPIRFVGSLFFAFWYFYCTVSDVI